MKRIIALLALIAAPLLADEASEIKAHWLQDPNRNDIGRYVKRITRKPITYTVSTQQVARASYPYEVSIREALLRYTNSLAGLGQLDANGRYDWVKALGKASRESAATAVEKLAVVSDWLEIKGDEDQAKVNGGGIGSPDALRPTKDVVTRTPVQGQSIAERRGWSEFLASENKVNYIRGAIR